MKPATSPSALKVQAVLGEDYQVLEFETSTRTAADAAEAVGCTVGQIAKSLIFRAMDSGRPVLAIASGSVRVEFETIWAAGGTPSAVFRLCPDDLVRLTGGTVAAIAK